MINNNLFFGHFVIRNLVVSVVRNFSLDYSNVLIPLLWDDLRPKGRPKGRDPLLSADTLDA